VSRIFDSMRRAEEDRRKKADQAIEARGAENRGLEKVTPAPEVPRPAGISREFLRELGMLRNAIDVALAQKDKKTILFTSALGGEGTTTVATNYARILALEGRERVLICEMNARRPSFSRVFSTNGDSGVTEYFLSRDSLASHVRKSQPDGLDVLHVGQQDATVIQLYLKQVFPRLLDEALRTYDTVIIDAAPVVTAPETPPLTGFVDGVVVVVHAGKTKREIVQRALASIASFGGNVLGIVLNRKRYYIPGYIYRRI
jgi:protein-tyrosine kinase